MAKMISFVLIGFHIFLNSSACKTQRCKYKKRALNTWYVWLKYKIKCNNKCKCKKQIARNEVKKNKNDIVTIVV